MTAPKQRVRASGLTPALDSGWKKNCGGNGASSTDLRPCHRASTACSAWNCSRTTTQRVPTSPPILLGASLGQLSRCYHTGEQGTRQHSLATQLLQEDNGVR